MFVNDSWLEWVPDPDRAAREATPDLEPFASMSRGQLLTRMFDAKGGREWEFLQEYFLDRCTDAELAAGPAEFIRTHYRLFRPDERCFLLDSVTLALRRRAGSRGRGGSNDDAAGHGKSRGPFGSHPRARRPSRLSWF